MAEMSKEEWAQKDKNKQASIVAQSSMERAVELHLAGKTDTLESMYNKICEMVWKKSKALANEDITSNTLPVPHPKQRTLLNSAKAKYEFTDEEIFEANGNKYPNNATEMKAALTKLGVKYGNALQSIHP